MLLHSLQGTLELSIDILLSIRSVFRHSLGTSAGVLVFRGFLTTSTPEILKSKNFFVLNH